MRHRHVGITRRWTCKLPVGRLAGTLGAMVDETAHRSEGSIVDRLSPVDWSVRDTARYEAAIEVLSGMVASCSQRLRELELAHADRAQLAAVRAEQGDYAAQIMELRPEDHDEISRVLSVYGAALRADRRTA
jgi:hypothetical protein